MTRDEAMEEFEESMAHAFGILDERDRMARELLGQRLLEIENGGGE